MEWPTTPSSLLKDPPTPWGPIVEDGKRFVTDRAAKLVARRLRLPYEIAAERLLEIDDRQRYLLLERIAESRHAAVYAGVDRLLAREVAIKIHRDPHEHARRRALVEARTLSGLEHPNIVAVYDLGEADGWLYAVTELCETDLCGWCIERSWLEIIGRIIETGNALEHLHAAGYVHGDIKPANILVKKGAAKLADFGLAARQGRALVIAGTPGFIAPEVAAGNRSPAGDVFALAVTAWACLFGAMPFGQPPEHADAEAAVVFSIDRLTRGELETPPQFPRKMPRLVLEIIERGLNPDPARRPALSDWLAELRFIRDRSENSRAWRMKSAAALCVLTLVGCSGYALHAATGPRGLAGEQSSFVGAILAPTLACQRAITAAETGEGTVAVHAIHQAYLRFPELPSYEQLRLAEVSRIVAGKLEHQSLYDEAKIIWAYAELLHRRVGRPADEAQTRAKLYAPTPTGRRR